MRLLSGRPERTEHRLKKEIRVYDFLDELQITYEHVDHEPAETMEECEEIDRVLQAMICKNLFLCNAQKTKFYMLMVCGNKKFMTKEISKQIDSPRLSFAPEEKMLEYLDITPGSVSVLGLMNDRKKEVQLLIDKELVEHDLFGCHPCMNTTSLRIRTKDLLETILPATGHEPKFVEIG